MNNWKNTVSRINRDRYQIPAGWDTKETVAKNLECDPDRVGDILKPGIAAGEIERGEFPVWDDKRRMAVRVVCYRVVTVVAEKVPVIKTISPNATLSDRIRNTILSHPDWSVRKIVKNHRGATTEMVRNLLKK